MRDETILTAIKNADARFEKIEKEHMSHRIFSIVLILLTAILAIQ